MIIVDERETRSKVYQLLQKMDIPIQTKQLEVGDYIVGNVCIERKEINDYVGSLISGRLHTQLYHMSYNYPISIIIIEGYIDEVLMYRKIKKEQYISSLAGTIYKRAPDGAQGVISLVMLSSPYDTAIFLKYLHEKVEKDEPRLPKFAKRKAESDWDRAVRVLAMLPGISEVRAEKLLERFGSIYNVVNASVSELLEVEGIGRKTAESLHELIRKNVRR